MNDAERMKLKISPQCKKLKRHEDQDHTLQKIL